MATRILCCNPLSINIVGNKAVMFRSICSVHVSRYTRWRYTSRWYGDDSKLKIYTRGGDKGTTVTFEGVRRAKDDGIFEALGCTDELSSHIGVSCEHCESNGHDLTDMLREIQCDLQDVGSHIAVPRTSEKATPTKLEETEFSETRVDKLEKWIDKLDTELPPLLNFILPSGGKSSTSLHVARTICRRTERRIATLYHHGNVDQSVLKYVNRLSDLLFNMARYTAHREGKDEIIYQRSK